MIVFSTPSTLNVNVSSFVGAVSKVILYVTVAPSSSPLISDVNVAFVVSIVSVIVVLAVVSLFTISKPPPLVPETVTSIVISSSLYTSGSGVIFATTLPVVDPAEILIIAPLLKVIVISANAGVERLAVYVIELSSSVICAVALNVIVTSVSPAPSPGVPSPGVPSLSGIFESNPSNCVSSLLLPPNIFTSSVSLKLIGLKVEVSPSAPPAAAASSTLVKEPKSSIITPFVSSGFIDD